MTQRRPAAVVFGIISTPPHGVIFVERAAHLRSHPGQIGLPGGAIDAADGGDLRQTALRELHEEVGIDAARVDFVWEFPALSPRVNDFIVTSYVAVVAPGPLRIDPSETAAVFMVPLESLLRDVRDGSIHLGAMEIETTLLDFEGRRIWGLTGRILRMFVDEWNGDGVLKDCIESRLRRKPEEERPSL